MLTCAQKEPDWLVDATIRAGYFSYAWHEETGEMRLQANRLENRAREVDIVDHQLDPNGIYTLEP